jgi:hypothetical protein
MNLERLKQMQEHRTRYEALLRIINALPKHPDLAKRVMPQFAEGRALIGGFMERGVAIGALRNDLPVGALLALIEAVKMSAYQSLYPGDQVLTEAQLQSFTDLVIDLGRRICSR